jgi:hypothetical protein
MKRALCIGLCLAGAAVPAHADAEKPNIVVVVADDMGWYTNRRTRHTDIRQGDGAGRQALPGAVTGDQ